MTPRSPIVEQVLDPELERLLDQRTRELSERLAEADWARAAAERTADERAGLLRAAALLHSSLQLDDVLNQAAQQALRLLHADGATLYLYDESKGQMELSAYLASNLTVEQIQTLGRGPLAAHPLLGQVKRTRRPVLVAPQEHPGAEAPRPGKITSSLLVPLLHGDALLGVLVLDRQEATWPFDQHELQLAEALAALASLAIANAQHHNDLQDQVQQGSAMDTGRTRRLVGLGQIVASVALELNNPLAIVSGYAELLAAQELPPQVAADVQRLAEAAERCRNVVHNLMSFTQRLPGQRSLVDLNVVLETALAQCQLDLQAAGITVTRRLAPHLPGVDGDANMLQQVLTSIIGNAREAMPQASGARVLTVCSGDRPGSGGTVVRLEISDSGPGIPAHVMPKIFDPFFSQWPSGRGLGLGLSVCFDTVQEHRGRIWAVSPALHSARGREGKGATFVIELPAAIET